MRTRFATDDLVIHRIIEQEDGFTPIMELLPGLTREVLEENRAWLQPSALDPATDMLVMCFQSYLVKTPYHTVLIDSCIGNDKDRPHRETWHRKQDDHYMRALAAAGVSVDDIDFVMCTHLHADHVGWNTRLDNGRWVPTFPKARYLFSQMEYDHWAAEHKKTPIPALADSVLPVVEARRADFVTSDHELGDHIRFLPTPGHTPDHFAVCLGRRGDKAVMTGDLIHSPLQARYPELGIRFDTDQQQAGATRRRFLDRFCDTETLVCTMHFPSPSVGRIKPWENGFRCDFVAD